MFEGVRCRTFSCNWVFLQCFAEVNYVNFASMSVQLYTDSSFSNLLNVPLWIKFHIFDAGHDEVGYALIFVSFLVCFILFCNWSRSKNSHHSSSSLQRVSESNLRSFLLVCKSCRGFVSGFRVELRQKYAADLWLSFLHQRLEQTGTLTRALVDLNSAVISLWIWDQQLQPLRLL